MNEVMTRMQRKYDMEKQGSTVTALYSCHIIDVHPETLSVDVIVLQLGKTLLGVAINSAFFSNNVSEIIMPEIGSEAILASTSDGTAPFIIAYRQPLKYEKDETLKQRTMQGEIIRQFKHKGFHKADNTGLQMLSSGKSDSIELGHNDIEIMSSRIDIISHEDPNFVSYGIGEITDETKALIMKKYSSFSDILGKDGIFTKLTKLDADDSVNSAKIDAIVSEIQSLIDGASIDFFVDNRGFGLDKYNSNHMRYLLFSPVGEVEKDERPYGIYEDGGYYPDIKYSYGNKSFTYYGKYIKETDDNGLVRYIYEFTHINKDTPRNFKVITLCNSDGWPLFSKKYEGSNITEYGEGTDVFKIVFPS